MASFGELYFYLYFELVTVYKSYYIYDHTLNQWFWKCDSLSSLSIARELLEMHILRPHHGPTESETLGDRPAICVFTNPFHGYAAATIWQPLL